MGWLNFQKPDRMVLIFYSVYSVNNSDPNCSNKWINSNRVDESADFSKTKTSSVLKFNIHLNIFCLLFIRNFATITFSLNRNHRMLSTYISKESMRKFYDKICKNKPKMSKRVLNEQKSEAKIKP